MPNTNEGRLNPDFLPQDESTLTCTGDELVHCLTPFNALPNGAVVQVSDFSPGTHTLTLGDAAHTLSSAIGYPSPVDKDEYIYIGLDSGDTVADTTQLHASIEVRIPSWAYEVAVSRTTPVSHTQLPTSRYPEFTAYLNDPRNILYLDGTRTVAVTCSQLQATIRPDRLPSPPQGPSI